jgi:hypothetical protein
MLYIYMYVCVYEYIPHWLTFCILLNYCCKSLDTPLVIFPLNQVFLNDTNIYADRPDEHLYIVKCLK